MQTFQLFSMAVPLRLGNVSARTIATLLNRNFWPVLIVHLPSQTVISKIARFIPARRGGQT
jgi:hypothetical protein